MTDQTSVRVYSEEDKMLPRVLIRGVLALIAAVMAITVFATITDRPLASTPPLSNVVAETHVVLISDGVSGAVLVTDTDGAAIAALSAEDGGFVAGLHRVILRERTKHRAALDGPVTLFAYENGRMAITDPSTGWSADLMGFGADNASAIAHLLAKSQTLTKGGNTHGTTD